MMCWLSKTDSIHSMLISLREFANVGETHNQPAVIGERWWGHSLRVVVVPVNRQCR
jgi:hypothetical protein